MPPKNKLAKNININVPESNNMVRLVVLVIVALLSTFFLAILEKTILPWPWLVEELVKTVAVVFLILPLGGKNSKILGAIIFALIFSLSESIFYFLNFIDNNELDIYWQRFVWPLAMHLVTMLIILFSVWKNKNWWLVGLLLAMLIHWSYNNFWLTSL